MRLIIGVAGQARSGKDTIAKFLIDNFGFKRFAFADQLKGIVNGMFGWDERHTDGELKEVDDPEWGFSPRRAYQLFGTEFGRALNPNLWVKMADKAMGTGLWVVPDVRFDNEANFIRLGGHLIHVHRPNNVTVAAHISEQPIPPTGNDMVIHNNWDISALHEQVRYKMHYLLKGIQDNEISFQEKHDGQAD